MLFNDVEIIFANALVITSQPIDCVCMMCESLIHKILDL